MSDESTVALTPYQLERKLEGACKKAYTEGHQAGLKENMTESVTLERHRIREILGSEAAVGRGEMAHYVALDTDMSAEDAIMMLAKSPLQKAPSYLNKLMENYKPGIGSESPDDGEASIDWAEKMNVRKAN